MSSTTVFCVCFFLGAWRGLCVGGGVCIGRCDVVVVVGGLVGGGGGGE